MEDKIIEKMEESIKKIMDEGLNTSNLETLYKLSKIKHIAKEDKEMYKDYEGYNARGYGRENYGEYNARGYGEYNARGRRRRYRGDDQLERMSDEYGRYKEGRSQYGNDEETDKSFHFMIEALKDFIKVLYEEADTPQQKDKLRQALQNSMM